MHLYVAKTNIHREVRQNAKIYSDARKLVVKSQVFEASHKETRSPYRRWGMNMITAPLAPNGKTLLQCCFYLSHCYSIAYGTDYKIAPVISVCLSVCVSALSRSQFSTDFDEIWHRHLEPDTKEPFRWGSISNKGIPYFYPIFP